jgi:hypothetical protein
MSLATGKEGGLARYCILVTMLEMVETNLAPSRYH